MSERRVAARASLKRARELEDAGTDSDDEPEQTQTASSRKPPKGKTAKQGQQLAASVASVRIPYTNKQRVLIVGSRGINARFRHFLEDLKKIIPHHKKDNKLDCKGF